MGDEFALELVDASTETTGLAIREKPRRLEDVFGNAPLTVSQKNGKGAAVGAVLKRLMREPGELSGLSHRVGAHVTAFAPGRGSPSPIGDGEPTMTTPVPPSRG